MQCSERRELILLEIAGALDPAEQMELRAHLAAGCAQCAGYLAEAEALAAQLTAAGGAATPPPQARDRLLKKIRAGRGDWNWERIIVPSAIAAILAVGVTLAAVAMMSKQLPPGAADSKTLAALEILNQQKEAQIHDLSNQLLEAKRGLADMKLAQLTGSAQPAAVGRVFIDTKDAKWYFFTTGMTAPPAGKTYELWLIVGDQKIPAGTFNVDASGNATMLGAVPTLPAGAAVTLCVTDEPTGGVKSPTGTAQIQGNVD